MNSILPPLSLHFDFLLATLHHGCWENMAPLTAATYIAFTVQIIIKFQSWLRTIIITSAAISCPNFRNPATNLHRCIHQDSPKLVWPSVIYQRLSEVSQRLSNMHQLYSVIVSDWELSYRGKHSERMAALFWSEFKSSLCGEIALLCIKHIARCVLFHNRSWAASLFFR